MFNLEGLIPKLCQLAQEDGDDDRALCLRSAGLQVLASMVVFSLLFSLYESLCTEALMNSHALQANIYKLP